MKTNSLFPLLRHLTMIAALALAALSAVPSAAEAQGVAVLVNGDPVTDYDIDQRIKLLQLGGQGQKAPARQQVVEDLINEKLKIQLLKRYAIPDVDKDVDSAYANMARRMRQAPKEFSEQLARGGVMPETLKSRMKAELVWNQIVRGRYQASFQFSDKDIQQRLQAKNPEGTTTASYDYTLRPILFVVPRGSPNEAFAARAKEAETLRTQFQNCEEGVVLARGMRFVAVRPPVVKNSADLPAQLRDILTKTEMGKLTPPETTQQGVEVYAVCGRKQSDNAPEKKEIRDQLYTETFDSLAKNYLKELRSQAWIEYKQ
jgi:peptidyl-prolyl cis-trans isomerase SurA